MKMFAADARGETWGTGLGLSEYGAALSDMDDIWTSLDANTERFELLDLPLGEFALDDELGNFLDWSIDVTESAKIVHHDCMWAGTCSDKYHPGNVPDELLAPVPAAPPAPLAPAPPAAAPVTLQSTLPGRSLLLSTARAPPRPPPSPRRPDTPQSLDEEEPPQFKHSIDLAACASIRPAGFEYAFEEEDASDPEDENEDDEEEEEEDEDDDYSRRYTAPPQHRDSRTYRENTIASDHSYTLCKTSKQTRIDSLGVQTPSDSEEEEIDVESLGEKLGPGARGAVALPTNPSAMDRHQLQRTVATAMGGRPRKRPRDREPPSPPKHRKRQKHAKIQRQSPPKRRAPSSPNSDSEADNVEKRSLHNDMERQRRIGLKNLFDELKREVPSISEKERAPKVVVLREAAALCARLQREEREREQLRLRQTRLLARVRHLRVDLAARRPTQA